MLEAIDEALAQHAKAKRLEAQALAFKQEAREFILNYFRDYPAEFKPVDDKTVEIRRGTHQTTITLPMSTEVPAHFDQSKAKEFREKVIDIYGGHGEDYFDIVYTLDEDRWFKDIRQADDDKKAAMHELVAPFVIAKVESQPLAPRVSSK